MDQFHFSGRPGPASTGLFGQRRLRVPVNERHGPSETDALQAPLQPMSLEEIRTVARRWRRGADVDDRCERVADALDAVADHRMGALGPKPAKKKSVTQRISELMGL